MRPIMPPAAPKPPGSISSSAAAGWPIESRVDASRCRFRPMPTTSVRRPPLDGQFAQHATELAAVEHQIVGPFERRRHAGRTQSLGHAETAGQCRRSHARVGSRHRHRQREQQRAADARVPAATVAAAAGRLKQRRAQHGPGRLRLPRTVHEIGIGRTGLLDRHDFELRCVSGDQFPGQRHHGAGSAGVGSAQTGVDDTVHGNSSKLRCGQPSCCVEGSFERAQRMNLPLTGASATSRLACPRSANHNQAARAAP
jgi:hypothetical protein